VNESRLLRDASTTPSSRFEQYQRAAPGSAVHDGYRGAVRPSPISLCRASPIFAANSVRRVSVYGINVKYTSMYMSEEPRSTSRLLLLVPLGQMGQQGCRVVDTTFPFCQSVSGFHGNRAFLGAAF